MSAAAASTAGCKAALSNGTSLPSHHWGEKHAKQPLPGLPEGSATGHSPRTSSAWSTQDGFVMGAVVYQTTVFAAQCLAHTSLGPGYHAFSGCV